MVSSAKRNHRSFRARFLVSSWLSLYNGNSFERGSICLAILAYSQLFPVLRLPGLVLVLVSVGDKLPRCPRMSTQGEKADEVVDH